MRSADPTRLYLWTGLLFRASVRGYWVAFAVRVVVDLDLAPLQLVLLGTGLELTILLSEVPTGVVADVVSRKWSVVIAYLIMGGAIIATGLVEPFGLLIVSQVVWGFGWTFQSGAETAWITDEVGSAAAVEPLVLRRARLQVAASIVGMAAGALLAAITSLSTTIVAAGIVMAAWGVVLAAVMPERHFVRQPGSSVDQARRLVAQGGSMALGRPVLRVLVLAVFVAGLAAETADRLDIRRLVDIGLPSEVDEIVVIGVIACCEALVGALLLWRIEDRVRGRHAVMALTLLLAFAAVGVAVLGLVAVWPVAAAGLVFQGGLRTAAEPIVVTWTNAHAAGPARATVHSFVGQAQAAGEILGGLALGAVAAATTVPWAMSLSAGLFAVAAAIAARGRRHWTTAPPSHPGAAG